MIKHLLYRCFLSVFTLLISVKAYAQNPIGQEAPAIAVIASAYTDHIKLRWAPNTPLVWKYCNANGYVIERHTIVRDGVILDKPEIEKLNTEPFKPKPKMAWESFVDKNDLAGVAAQALYGDDFEVELQEGGNGMLAIINQSRVLEQRFTFALYAADQDFDVALFSGLAYVDKNVKQGERYLYKITAAVPRTEKPIAFASVYVGIQDYKPLPKPLEFVGVFGDKSVMLTWNYKLLEQTYTNYNLERSSDNGKTYQQINDTPITNLSTVNNEITDRIVFLDSLPSNDTTYQYRLKGISPFGDIGPASDIIEGKGIKQLSHSAALTAAELHANNISATLTWEYPSEGMETVSHFELNHSNKLREGYRIAVSPIDKNKRSIIVDNLSAINYYTITTVGKDGNKITSFPRMVQPVDDAPPSNPVGLSGIIDSTGVVKLTWQKNTEIDFRGYRVFRANRETEEFVQITFDPIPEPTIIDTINIKTLNKKIYYKVQAFDKRYNPSNFSEILELKRPDIVPPTAPVFETYKTSNGAIELQWIASSSEDAAYTAVYKKPKGTDAPWELVSQLKLPDSSYLDKDITPGTTYLYTLITVDESGLESEPIIPLTILAKERDDAPEINRFTAVVNREQQHITLNWNYKEANVTEYMLYRGTNKKALALYKVFTPELNTYTDKDLTVNTVYTYLLQAVFQSGKKSPQKTLSVKY